MFLANYSLRREYRLMEFFNYFNNYLIKKMIDSFFKQIIC